MASNTREAMREARTRRQQLYDDYLARFVTLFHNSIILENLDVPKRYLIKLLLERGAVAFDRETNVFLPFVAAGIDLYGLPTMYTLIGYNGRILRRKPNEVVILRANDLQYAYYDYYRLQSAKLANFDMAIEQNLEAIKTMTIAEVEDSSQLLSNANKIEARQIGATYVTQNKKLAMGQNFHVESTGAQYLVDKLLQDRREVFNETLATIGGLNANTSKRERVQSDEIYASEGFGFDCLNTLIDTFNYDAEVGGMSFRLKANTSLFNLKEELETENVQKDTE